MSKETYKGDKTMKLNKYWNRLQDIYEELDELIGDLEEKRDSIEERAIDHDRDMTEKEKERYDELDELIEAIRECQDNIEYATEAIIDYTDY